MPYEIALFWICVLSFNVFVYSFSAKPYKPIDLPELLYLLYKGLTGLLLFGYIVFYFFYGFTKQGDSLVMPFSLFRMVLSGLLIGIIGPLFLAVHSLHGEKEPGQLGKRAESKSNPFRKPRLGEYLLFAAIPVFVFVCIVVVSLFYAPRNTDPTIYATGWLFISQFPLLWVIAMSILLGLVARRIHGRRFFAFSCLNSVVASINFLLPFISFIPGLYPVFGTVIHFFTPVVCVAWGLMDLIWARRAEKAGIALARETYTTADSRMTLTRRERQVAELLAQGLVAKEIASRLTLSTRTAETHIAHIYRKTGVRDREGFLNLWVGEIRT